MNIDNLMLEYSRLNEKLSQNNQLNEKIFKEMIWQKSKTKLDIVALNDYGSLFLTGIMLAAGILFTLKNTNDNLLLAVSLIAIMAWTGLLVLVIWPMYIQKDLKIDEESISTSLEKIRKLYKAYGMQRNIGMLMMPFLMFIVPVMWKSMYNYNFLDAFKNWWTVGFIIAWTFAGIIIMPLVYKVTYFKWLNEAQNILNRLNEELLFLKE